MSIKPKEKVDEVDEEKEELKSALSNLTEELKDVRTSRAEDRKALDALLKAKEEETPPAPDDGTDAEKNVNTLIEQALVKRDNQSVENNYKTVESNFKNSINEFKEDNDSGGLKYAAFQKELNKFNLSGLTSKEELTARFKEVYEFMNRNKAPENQSNLNQYAATPPSNGVQPKEVDNTTLSRAELDLIKNHNWTKDRYIKLKERQPQYIQSLLRYLN